MNQIIFNMSVLIKYYSPFLLLTSVVLAAKQNSPVVCTEEGYQVDPYDCTAFYRCVKSDTGKYTVFKFDCGPGTVYDPENEICNFPANSKRSGCTRSIRADQSGNVNENEINPSIAQELPSPIKINQAANIEHITVKRDVTSKVTIPWILPSLQTSSAKLFSTSSPMPVNKNSNLKGDDKCRSNGFIGDSKNCRVFYRCVGNGRGGFTKYEFSCSDETIWDDDVQSCNYPSIEKRNRCGRSSDTSFISSTQDLVQENDPTIQQQTQINYGAKVTQLQLQVNNGTAIQNQTQINYGQKVNQNQRQENYDSNNIQNQISYNTAVSQTQAEINYGNKVVQTQVQIDHTKQASQQQQQTVSYGSEDDEDTSTPNNSNYNKPQVTQSSQSDRDNNKCHSNGFMGDSNDCKKFYRCVDDGKGKFTRYEFSCGDGTYWDSSIESCNHEWAVKNCSQRAPIASTSTVISTTPVTKTTPQIQTTPDDEDTSYGSPNQSPLPSESSKPITVSQSSLATTEEYKPEKTKCSKSGFMGDNFDCNKFYRCVDDGKGSFTKYEFTCGEGTVWDPEIESCNHAWAVSKICGGSSSSDNDVVKTTTITTTTKKDNDVILTTSSSTSQTTENDDYDTGYGPSQTSLVPSSIATKPPELQQPDNKNKCTTSGFMGDSNDCKKFYRCVDNGIGGYTLYEFSCGEGTVWDNNIDACNHAWAVKSCGSGGDQSSQTPTEITIQESTPSESGTSGTSPSSPSIIENVSTTQTPSKTPDYEEICNSEGFKGDINDCKKFYRCVDNGKGGYIKYEFTCGEGTIWDPEIQGCNHQLPNKKCGNSLTNSTTTTEKEIVDDEISTIMTSKTTLDSSQTTMSPTYTTKQPAASTDICKSEGFNGDSRDCQKFYRCVDNGKDGFTKYDFTCGEGTVWDQEIQGCNHPKDKNFCIKSPSSISTTTAIGQESTSQSQDITVTTTKMETSTTSIKTTTSSSDQGHCSSDGFYPNPSDCKKFYRCVSDGKGGYTKYDFTCGDGTVWVQDIQACDHDNDVNSCSTQSTSPDQQEGSSTSQPQTSKQPDQQTSIGTSTVTESSTQDNQISGQSSTGSTPVHSGKCSSEGFYANENDCRKFYRCVDNGKGGYTKYDFTCGEGTAWDSNIQSCNHINEVNCVNNGSGEQNTTEIQQDDTLGTTESTSTTIGIDTTESTVTTSLSEPSSQGPETTTKLKPNNKDECTEEGFFGNSQDCKKFYRCVDNGKGGYTKYDFDCGEGTIWDQDILACNHPGDVNNLSCKEEGQGSTSSTAVSPTTELPEQSTTKSSTQSLMQSTSSSSAGNNQDSSNCSQEITSKKPEIKKVNCTKEGFYGDPNDCKKFYRCVDWDGNGEKFSVYHFECGEGTIWDPSLDTCNHEDSVYPPRDCSGTPNLGNETTEGTTTKQDETTTTMQEMTTSEKEQSTTTELQATTQDSTTQSTTTRLTTTQKSTTQESTTTEQTSEQSTSEQTTLGQPTTEQTTTQQSATEQTTTQQPSTEQSTTGQSSTTDQSSTTEQSSITEQSSTTEQSNTTEQSTTEDNTMQQSTTEQSSESTTQIDQGSSTESQESTTTEQSTEPPSQKECPDTDSDQYLYVCPTGFKRHPKYCNLFYQCTEDETHEVKIATFNCPNNTIYDENKTQCVEEMKAEKKCNGQIAQKRRFKRLNADTPQPIFVSKQKLGCPLAGHYPFQKEEECSPAFLKCEKAKSGKIRGFVYRCPNDFVYWSVSRRCEPKSKLKNCKESVSDWSARHEIPIEKSNVAH